jgi:hypothetical protein
VVTQSAKVQMLEKQVAQLQAEKEEMQRTHDEEVRKLRAEKRHVETNRVRAALRTETVPCA